MSYMLLDHLFKIKDLASTIQVRAVYKHTHHGFHVSTFDDGFIVS